MKVMKKLLFAVMLMGCVVPQQSLQASVKDDFKLLVDLITAIGEQAKKDLKTAHKFSLRNILDAAGVKEDQLPAPLAKFLDSIEFQTPKLRIDKETYEVTWDEALVVGVKYKLSTRLYVGPSTDGKSSGFSFSIGLPGKNTLNTLFPDIKKNLKLAQDTIFPENVRKVMQEAHLTVDDFAKIVDWLEFEDMGWIVGTQFDDPVWGQILTGVNLHATLRFVGPLKQITDMLGKDLTTVQARGVMTLTGGGTEIRAIYPGKYTLFRWPLDPMTDPFFHIRTSGLEARAGMTYASNWFAPALTIKMMSGFDVKLPLQKDYVALKGSADIMPLGKAGPSFEIAGWMEGMIKDMFGLPGFDVGNLGLAMTLPFAVFVGEVVPTGVEMQGEVHIGPLKPSCVISINIDKQQVAAIAKLAAMSREDFAAWIVQLAQAAAQLGKGQVNVPALKAGLAAGMPPFKLSDLEFYFVPAAAEIFETRYSTGIYIKGYGEIFGYGGGLHVAAYYFGLKAALYLNEIKIPKANPFIIISGTEKAKDSLAKMSGPTMTGEISPDKKTQYGSANDINFTKGPIVLAELSTSRQLLYMDGLLKLPALGIESSTHIIINPTDIECDLKTKLAGYDSELHIKGNPLKPETFVMNGFVNQQGLGVLGNVLQAEAKKFSEKAQKDLNAASQEVTKWQQQANRDIDAWIALQVINVNNEIDALKIKIRDTNDGCNRVFWMVRAVAPVCWDAALNPVRWIDVGIKMVHRDVTLKGIVRDVAKVGVGVIGGTAKVGIAAAQVGVEFARATTDFAGKLLAGGLNITNITLEGSLQDLGQKGTLPRVDVAGTILGKPFKQTYQVDFKNPNVLPAQIIAGLVQVFGPQPQPYKSVIAR